MFKLDSSQVHKDGSIDTNQLMGYTTSQKKDKKRMIISTDAEKASDIIQHPFCFLNFFDYFILDYS